MASRVAGGGRPCPAARRSCAAVGGNGDCLRLECRRLRAARKPLAALGLGLTSALGVRSARLLAPFAAFVSHQPAREGRRRTPMNRLTVIWNGASFR
jgi:hypothetical protein